MRLNNRTDLAGRIWLPIFLLGCILFILQVTNLFSQPLGVTGTEPPHAFIRFGPYCLILFGLYLRFRKSEVSNQSPILRTITVAIGAYALAGGAFLLLLIGGTFVLGTDFSNQLIDHLGLVLLISFLIACPITWKLLK